MKKIIFTFLFAIVVALLFVGCDKDSDGIRNDSEVYCVARNDSKDDSGAHDNSDRGAMDGEWDITPVNLVLLAANSAHDLFDPEYEGNILDKVSVTYEGKEYKVESATRAYFAEFYGLRYIHYGDNIRRHILIFGEFDGVLDYEDMTFVVNWPNDEKDVVVYNRTFGWKDNLPDVKQTTTVNGKETGGLYILKKFE